MAGMAAIIGVITVILADYHPNHSTKNASYRSGFCQADAWPHQVMGGNLLVSLLAGFGDTFHVVHKVDPWHLKHSQRQATVHDR